MSARVHSAGDRLDRFEVVSVLGDGGSATVYRVRHVLLGSEYALKLVAAPSGEDRERLLREGRAQSTLRHRNIVPVLDAVSIGEDLGLVLELVDGPDLARWLETHRPDLATVDRMATDLFDGLALAHAHGFIHRDLKPSNVLIANPDGDVTARVVDFGLAKDFTDVSPGLTQSTWIFGTPAYAAPEQAAGASTVDVRADVFSLGAVLYEIATGQRAFPGKNILDVMQTAADEKYADPRTLREDIPTRMVMAIHAALRANPEDRVPDVATLRAIWSSSGAPAAALAPPPRRAMVEVTPAPVAIAADASRWPVWVGLGVAALVVTVMVVGMTPRATGPYDPTPQAPEPSTPVSGGTANVAEDAPEAPAPAPQATSSDAAVPSTPGSAALHAPAGPKPRVAASQTSDIASPLPPPTPTATLTSAAEPPAPKPPPKVRIEGDVSEVVLFAADGERVSPGVVREGSYVVEARFRADEPRVHALSLDLSAGDVVTVTCSAGLRRCAPRKLSSAEAP